MESTLTLWRIREAARTLALQPAIVRTPTLYSAGLSRLLLSERGIAANVYLKLESLQNTRSYKIRGAYNKVSALVAERGREAIRELVTASAGNHAQGVAFAAAAYGLAERTIIYMPWDAPPSKREGTARFGVRINQSQPSYDAARRVAEAVHDPESGRFYIAAYDDLDVMAGQGTVGLEILASLRSGPHLAASRTERTTIVCPVGGGGLLGGVAAAAFGTDPTVRVVGVEPVGAAKTLRSLATGARYERPEVSTAADGVRVAQLGALTFEVIRKLLGAQQVRNVSEARIHQALRLLVREGLVVEYAGALALASLLRCGPQVGGKDEWETGESAPLDLHDGENVVLVVSGGNVSAADLHGETGLLAHEEAGTDGLAEQLGAA